MRDGLGRWGGVIVLVLAGCAAARVKGGSDAAVETELPDVLPPADVSASAPDLPLPDAAADLASPDLATPDAEADLAPDTAADTAPDLAADLAPDVAPDVSPDSGPPDAAPLASCGTDPLSSLPVDLTDLIGIIPLGNLGPPAHTLPSAHNYLALGNATAAAKLIPVRFPATGRVIRVLRYEGLLPGGAVEYSLQFTVCKELFFYFNHMVNLDPDFLTQIGDFPAGTCDFAPMRTCNKEVSIPISVGAVFAQLPVEAGKQRVFDFGARDARLPTPAGYANVARYYLTPDGNDLRHVACPWNYFPPVSRDGALALMGDPFALPPVRRTMEPRCGTVVQDLAGTAQGNWFGYPATSGTQYYEPPPQEDRAVSLVHDAMYPTRPVLSVGGLSNVGAGRYYFATQSSGRVNRDFADVTAGSGVYCYQGLTDLAGQAQGSGIVLLEATADSKLRLERLSFSSCGPGPFQFGPSVTTFDR
jgi:hypothetical protein